MSTRSKAIVAALAASALGAQAPDVRSSVKVNLAADAPVALVSADWGQSSTQPRGGAMVVDLHTALSLRNSGPRRIRGITLEVLAQEVTPGGRGSVTVCLDAAAGETFPVRIDLRLLRPLASGAGPLVSVSLDGVLFEDLSFYGPNRLKLRRAMTAWEMEAQRDRRHLQGVLAAGGAPALQRELLAAMARMADRPRLDVRLARGRATAVDAERAVELAFLRFPDQPVEAVAGEARIAANEARAPRVEVLNRSARPVRYLEISWLVRDRQGREYLAGAAPSEQAIAPGARGRLLDEAATLRFTDRGAAVPVESLTGFVSQVEFADGGLWVPARASDAALLRAVSPSPEEERLIGIYRKKGLAAVVEELKRF
jgi:hypothetical protein